MKKHHVKSSIIIILHFVAYCRILSYCNILHLTFRNFYVIFRQKAGKHMNNLKNIREIYGITQDEIAKAINVNRATISNWENQEDKKASSANLEKLSLFYGIGPEFFYNKSLNDTVRNMLVQNSNRQKKIEHASNGEHAKADDFSNLFSTMTFDKAIRKYMTATKLLLATADEGSLDKLETALKINEKMGARLESIVNIRKSENANNEESLSDLIDSLSSEN